MPIWFKLDVHLPSNPKVKKAASIAKAANSPKVSAPMSFVALLAINKMHAFRGVVPADYGAPVELAEWWRMEDGLEDMRAGLRACRDVGLVQFTPNAIIIVGWGPEWDRQESNAERQKAYRDRKKGKGKKTQPTETTETVTPLHNADNVTGEEIALQSNEGDHRGEENRGEEIEEKREPPTPLVKGESVEATSEVKPSKPKAKRKTEAERLLAKWNDQAGELWDLQEMLRSTAIPRSRPLQADAERLGRICKLLDRGVSLDDCRAVLRCYAAEAKANPDNARHFNGVTNWIKENFDRTLGGVGAGPKQPKPSAGRAKPMARDAVETGVENLA